MKRATACALSCAAGAATACSTERQLHTPVPLATVSTAAAVPLLRLSRFLQA
jgi:hypothetical protein